MTDRAGSEGLRPHDSTPEAPEGVCRCGVCVPEAKTEEPKAEPVWPPEVWLSASIAELYAETRPVKQRRYVRADLAAQERDAAVAAALEEAMAAVLAPPEADTLAAASEIARASERVEALPRNDTALRKHEVKLLREMADLLDGKDTSSHDAAEWGEHAAEVLRDEAARRKETTPAARTGSPSPQGAQSSRGIAE